MQQPTILPMLERHHAAHVATPNVERHDMKSIVVNDRIYLPCPYNGC